MEGVIRILIALLLAIVQQMNLNPADVTYHSFTTDAYQYPQSTVHPVSPGACIFLIWDVGGVNAVSISSDDGEINEIVPAKGSLLVKPSLNVTYYALSVDDLMLDHIDVYRPPSPQYPGNQSNDYHDPTCDREHP